MSLTQVLDFVKTASPADRAAVLSALTSNNSRVKAAATLSSLKPMDKVSFFHDNVRYEGTIQKINQTTAKVVITKIVGVSRNRIRVGMAVRVGASILARSK